MPVDGANGPGQRTSTVQYQTELSLQSPILLDRAYKQPKIEKMLAVLADCGAIDPQQPRGLAVDVGCSGGLFASALGSVCEQVVGVDIDTNALAIARRDFAEPNVLYLNGDSMRLPLPDACADVIICNHVYEHVPDARRLFAEIARILKADGRCFLGAASRLTLIEPHYHLPFLSWLPPALADVYMRVTGKGERYYERLRTLQGIRALISDFDVSDYTLEIVADPDRYRARDLIPEGGLIERIPGWAWRAFYWLLPSYIFILRKPGP